MSEQHRTRREALPESYRINAENLKTVESKLLNLGGLEVEECEGELLSFYSARVPKRPELVNGQEANEDNVINLVGENEDWFVTGVFDGVGGSRGGGFASLLLKKRLEEEFTRFSPSQNRENLREMISMVERVCDSTGEEIAKSDFFDAGTTISLTVGCLTQKDGVPTYLLCSLNKGDSRGYLTKGGYIEQTTIDDTYPSRIQSFSPAQAFASSNKNEIVADAFAIAAGLKINESQEYPEFKIAVGKVYELRAGDEEGVVIYHMTDGVTDNLRDDDNDRGRGDIDSMPYMEISKRIRAGISPQDLAFTARYRMESGMNFYINVNQNNAYVAKPISVKKDDIAVTKMVILPPSNKEILASLGQIFMKEGNQQLLGILADWHFGELNRRNEFSLRNIEEVIRQFKLQYPSVLVFENEVPEFLSRIDSVSKRNQYRTALLRFIALVYGKGVTHRVGLYNHE